MSTRERLDSALKEARRFSRQAREDRAAGRPFLFLSSQACRHSFMLLARAFRDISNAREVRL